MNPSRIPHTVKLFSQLGTGRVEQTIAPNQQGRVKYEQSYWPARLHCAECQIALLPDELVTVVGREGLTLLVVPIVHTHEKNENSCS